MEYALERRQGRSPEGRQPCALVEHPDVQRMLLTQKAWTEGGRALIHWAALLIDEAQWHEDEAVRADAAGLLGLLTPIIKGFLAENAQESLSLALQVYGGHGFVTETGIEQLVRDARITTIYEGTTGIQAQDLLLRNVIAGDGGRLRLLTSRVRGWLDSVEGKSGIAEFAQPLAQLLHTVETLTEGLIARNRESPASVLSVSVSYMRLLGHLVLAWLWARMAAAAMAAQTEGDNWYDLKLATARFYFSQLLAETQALKEAISSPTSDVAALLA